MKAGVRRWAKGIPPLSLTGPYPYFFGHYKKALFIQQQFDFRSPSYITPNYWGRLFRKMVILLHFEFPTLNKEFPMSKARVLGAPILFKTILRS